MNNSQKMGERNGDAKTFWMELEDGGKVDMIFEQVQNVLQSLKQKIKDGSATSKEYIQAMILVNEATRSNNSMLIKDHKSVTENEQENKSHSWPSTSCEESFPEDCTVLTKCACLQMTARNAEICPLSRDKITIGYKYKRLQRHIPTGIYECSLLCKCNRQMCQNRVVQHGPQVRLQVFKTEKKGWGVRCLDDIDRGTFVCTYSGRLLSRSNTEKPDAIGENRKEENIMKNVFSKRRKIEVADCEVEVIPLELDRSAKTEECPAKFNNNQRKPVIDMNCKSMSRIRYHSAIRTLKTKIAIIQPDGRKMGFTSSESVTSEGNDGFKPAQIHLTTKANDMKKCLLVNASSNQVEDSEDKLLIESDVIDITKCKEETSLRARYNEATTLDNQDIMKEFEAQILKPQEKRFPACQNQQVVCGEELSSEMKNTSDQMNTSFDSLKFSKENVFLLDATKEGNVGRFLNHSCYPNLLVQNVFVETHDRNFPLVAFFTNRYVKARTELTWDYGYEAGTVPDKEILCQCGVNKCRKKIL